MFFYQFDKIFPEMFLSIHWLANSNAFISSSTVSHGIRAVAGPCLCLISSLQSFWVTGLCPHIIVAELPWDALLWTWGTYSILYSLFLNINLLLMSVSLQYLALSTSDSSYFEGSRFWWAPKRHLSVSSLIDTGWFASLWQFSLDTIPLCRDLQSLQEPCKMFLYLGGKFMPSNTCRKPSCQQYARQYCQEPRVPRLASTVFFTAALEMQQPGWVCPGL